MRLKASKKCSRIEGLEAEVAQLKTGVPRHPELVSELLLLEQASYANGVRDGKANRLGKRKTLKALLRWENTYDKGAYFRVDFLHKIDEMLGEVKG